ncbi:MAG: SIR2 family protein, partial [Anaerolineae bacterium]|nr:SIR2 family protein [Anaerolineae bacterium]
MSSAPAESTIAIPTLVEEAKNGRLALLIGADLDRELTGVPSARDLALGLSPEVASLVEAARGKARWRPVSHLCNAMDSASESVGPLHAAAARLRLWSYATAAYDGGLQRALKTDHVEPNLLIEDSDLIERHSGRPDLFKLCGDMQRLHSLVISEADYRHQDDRKDLLKMLRGWLKEKTVLLIGCDPAPESDFARHLYGYILTTPDGFGGGAFLVWPEPSESLVAWWQQYN